MVCNLLLLEEHARRPWTWIPKQVSNKIQKLYYATVPLPGIYAITGDKRHYLVAIRPQGKKDTENIFEPAKRSWNVADPKSTPKREPTKKVTSSSKCHQNQDKKNGISREGSCSSCVLKPHIEEKRCFAEPELQKMCNDERPIHSANFIINGTGGKVPHQKSPFRNQLFNYDGHRSISTLFGRHWKCGIQEIDMNGFKKLRNPLRIEFCNVVGRWMFSSEIKIRSEQVEMCKDMACIKSSHESCKGTVHRRMFVLDDGYSWIVIGKSVKGKKGALFRVDADTDCMRRQTEEEVKISEFYLEKEKGRFLECSEEADYMCLVRYLKGPEVGNGRVERETPDLGGVGKESLQARCPEATFAGQWSERQKFAEKKIEQEWYSKERIAQWILEHEDFLKEIVQAERREKEWIETLTKLTSGREMGSSARKTVKEWQERVRDGVQKAADLETKMVTVKA